MICWARTIDDHLTPHVKISQPTDHEEHGIANLTDHGRKL